jgi:thioredoxin reductase
MTMPDRTDVAIIGSGPYGLSVGAHLAARGIDRRIFGPPMRSWQTAMPRGMKLKSDGFASSLYDPAGAFTLGHYCAERDLPYQDVGLPVPLETFIEYGLEFQRRFLPDLDTRQVATVERTANGYSLILDDGEEVWAQRVVVATGITNYSYVPPTLSECAPGLVVHSSQVSDENYIAGGAAGKEILIIGAGASAIDLAAMLGRSGASVTIIARRNKIAFNGAPAPRTWVDDVRAPISGLGTGWRSLMAVKAPLVFHCMPEPFRLLVVRKHLGPAPGWVPREYVEKHVAMQLGATITGIREVGGRAELSLRSADGVRTVAGDSVIAATGYRADLRRLTFIGRSVRGGLRCVDHTPILDRQFQSSVPGLYFTGLTAANSFGPLLRFAYGAGFVARRLTDHLHRTLEKNRYAVGVPSVAAAAAE